MNNIHVDLYCEAGDFDWSVDVEYHTQPAEPDVGIPVAYGEVQNVSTVIPVFGRLYIELDEYDLDKVEQAIDDEVWEEELTGGYQG